MLTCSNNKKLLVVDVETGAIVQQFENCTYNAGYDRAALAVDPNSATIAASTYINGRGVTYFDLRMPLPFDFHFDVRFFSRFHFFCFNCVYVFLVPRRRDKRHDLSR